MKKPLITLLTLLTLAACLPTENDLVAGVGVAKAENDLKKAKEEAAESVKEAREAAARQVDEAAADLKQARQDLRTRLDATEAQIVALDARATTQEQRDEVTAIRQRQALILVDANAPDRDEAHWRKMKSDVDAALDDLGRDIQKVGNKGNKMP